MIALCSQRPRIARLRTSFPAALPPFRRRPIFEALEQRLLLSGDGLASLAVLIPQESQPAETAEPFSYAMAAGANDLALALRDVASVPTLQLIDRVSQDVLAEQALAQTSEVIVMGSLLDDRFEIDASLLAASILISFDGGDGSDTLFGPPVAATWTITGEGAGSVAGVDFGGVENLWGAANNEDTFVVASTGSLSGILEGGDGGFDVIEIDTTGFGSVSYGYTGLQSGTIARDGDMVTYSGFEPLTQSPNSEDPHDVTVDYSGLANTGTNTVMVQLKPGDSSMLMVSSDRGEVAEFKIPTGSLKIIGHAGVDDVEIGNLGAFVGSLTIEGGDGNDKIDASGSSLGATLLGQAGNDSLVSSALADNLDGGAGDDTYEFGANWGDDTVSEAGSGGSDTLDFGDSAITLTVHGDASLRISGADGGAVTLSAESAANVESLVDPKIAASLLGAVESFVANDPLMQRPLPLVVRAGDGPGGTVSIAPSISDLLSIGVDLNRNGVLDAGRETALDDLDAGADGTVSFSEVFGGVFVDLISEWLIDNAFDGTTFGEFVEGLDFNQGPVTLSVGEVTENSGTLEPSFTLHFVEVEVVHQLPLDLGTEAQRLGINLPNSMIDVAAHLRFDLDIVVKEVLGIKALFVEPNVARELIFSVDTWVDGDEGAVQLLGGEVNVGFLGAGVTEGSATLAAEVTTAFESSDVLAAGETGRDNFALTLNASVKDGLQGFAPDFSIVLGGAPLSVPEDLEVDADGNERLALPVDRTGAFADVADFNAVTPAGVIGMLKSFGNWLEQLRASELYDKFDVPLTDATFRDLFAFGTLFNEAVTTQLLDESNGPIFATAQGLAEVLNAALPEPVNARYDATTHELLFDLSMAGDFEPSEVGASFDIDLSPMADVESASVLRLAGDTTLTLTVGIDLSPGPESPLSPGTPLADLNYGAGVAIKTSQAVTADDAVRTLYGQLFGDARWTVWVEGTGHDVAVLATDTSDNEDVADLVADINASLENANLSGRITAVQALNGDDTPIPRIELRSADPAIAFFEVTAEADDSAVREMGFLAEMRSGALLVVEASEPIAARVDLTGGASFDVKIGSATPVPVSIPGGVYFGAQTLVDEINDALEDKGISSVEAQQAGGRVRFVGDGAVGSFSITWTTGGEALGFGDAEEIPSEVEETPAITTTKSLSKIVGQLTGDASFDVQLDGEDPVTVTVLAEDTSANRNILDLVNDINRAIGEAMLGDDPLSDFVAAGSLGDRLVFTATGSISGFSIQVDSGDPALTELGLATSQDSNGDDLVITLSDASVVRVDLSSAETVGNVLEAINLAAVGSVLATLNDTGTALRLVDTTFDAETPANNVDTFRVEATNGSPAAVQLGMLRSDRTSADDAPDGVIEGGKLAGIRLADRFFVQEGGAIVSHFEVSPALRSVSGHVDGEGEDGIYFVASDEFDAKDFSALVTVSGSAGYFRIVDISGDDPETDEVEPSGASVLALGEQTLSDGASVTIEFPGIQASGRYGFVAVELIGEGALSGTLTTTILDPGADADATLPIYADDDRATLAELDKGLADPEVVAVAGPVASHSDGATDYGALAFRIVMDPGLDALVHGASLGSDPQIAIEVDSLDPLGVVVTQTDLGDLDLLADLEFSDVLDSLGELSAFLAAFETAGGLDDPLPLIGRSVADMLGFAQRFDRAVQAAEDDPASTLQELAAKLRQSLGLPAGDPDVLALSLAGDDFLRIDLRLQNTFSDSLKLDLDLGTDRLVAPKVLKGIGDLTIDLAWGIGLDDGNAYLFDDTQIAGTFRAAGDNISSWAVLRPDEGEPLSVYISGGIAELTIADIRAAPDFEGAAPFAELENLGFQVEVASTVQAALPVYYPSMSGSAIYTIEVPNGSLPETSLTAWIREQSDDGNGGESTPYEHLLTAVESIDSFLEGIQNLLDGEVLGIKLPFIGDKLSEGARFIEDLRVDFIAPLKDGVETFSDPDTNQVSKLLFELLGTGGADLLLDTNDDGELTVQDIGFTLQFDEEDKFVQWDLKLGQPLQPVAGINIDLDLGIPGLGLEIDGPLTLWLGWDLDLKLGVSSKDGPYLDVSDPDDLKLELAVELPERISGKLAFLQLDAENELPEGEFPLHAAFAIDLVSQLALKAGTEAEPFTFKAAADNAAVTELWFEPEQESFFGSVVSSNEVPENGQLGGELRFDLLTEAGTTYAITVSTEAYGDNSKREDLVDDIKAALASAGAGNAFEAGLDGKLLALKRTSLVRDFMVAADGNALGIPTAESGAKNFVTFGDINSLPEDGVLTDPVTFTLFINQSDGEYEHVVIVTVDPDTTNDSRDDLIQDVNEAIDASLPESLRSQLKLASGDPRMSFWELGDLGVQFGIAAEATADLGLTLRINSDLVDDPGVFPEISADFLLEWAIGDLDASNYVGFSDLGSAISEGLQVVEFTDVSLDLGSFISDFVDPVLGQVKKITEPIQDVVDFLTAPIPVISELGGPVTMLDLAGMFGNVDAGFITAIANVITLINSIPSDADSILINFGDFVIYDREHSVNDSLDLSDPGSLQDVSALSNWDANDLEDELNNAPDNGTTQFTKTITKSEGFSFPILSDPSEVFGMLLGKPATLVTYDLPELTLEFTYEQYFPIFGPLGASVSGTIGATIDFHEVGFDTSGIIRFADSGFRNPALIFDGFFISDLDAFGNDVPEVTLYGSIGAAAEINLVVVSAGVAGSVGVEVEFDLYDPDEDGKVRVSEIIGSIENEYRFGSKALSPLAMFDVSGEIFARLFAFFEIDLFFFSIRKEFNILPPITILEFGIDFTRPPYLATEIDGGVLQINAGEFAGERKNVNDADGAEVFSVRASTSAVTVGAFGFSQKYAGSFENIVMATGEGDDVLFIDLAPNVKLDLDLGGGNDRVILTGSGGEATIHGSGGDDFIDASNAIGVTLTIYGGEGSDTILGGTGNDIIFGGFGAFIEEEGGAQGVTVALRDDEGADSIDGGGGNDTIFGGGGADTLSGGAGDDVVLADSGYAPLAGSGITLQASSEALPIVSRSLVSEANRILGGEGNDTLYGGSGDDFIDGGADDDVILGLDGFDVLYGGSGADTIWGGAGADVIFGHNSDQADFEGRQLPSGPAEEAKPPLGEIYAGVVADFNGDEPDRSRPDGQDVIYGEDGNDIVFGGDESSPGDDIDGGRGVNLLMGEGGDDTLRGGQASTALYGGDGSDKYVIRMRGGASASTIKVADTGTSALDTDHLIVNGTDFGDQFLLRASADPEGYAFVALLNANSEVERINYGGLEQITVNGLAGNDRFASDDARAAVTLNGGIGRDFFQIGQLYRSPRAEYAEANIDPGDEFATIEVTRGFLSNGISRPMTVNGGADEDEFVVFHNKAVLTLNGGTGDDRFSIRAFALAGSQDDLRERTDISGGSGADLIQYAVNAPVNIDGGDGLDTLIVIGTEFADDFVITDEGVYGAGLNVNFVGIERLKVDGAEGDDRFFVLSTGANFVTEIAGGLGSDTFNMSGDTPPVVSNDLLGHSGIIMHSVESADPHYDGISVAGISANIADDDEPAIRITQSGGATVVGEDGLMDEYTIVLTRQPTRNVNVTVLAPVQTPEEDAYGWQGLEIAADGDWSDEAVTLTFTPEDWDDPQTVRIRAPADDAAEGVRYGAINHLVTSYTELATGTVESVDSSTLIAQAGFSVGDVAGAIVRITEGPGAGQERFIESWDPDTRTLTLYSPWAASNMPGQGSSFAILRDDAVRGIVESNIVDTFRDVHARFPIQVGGLDGATVTIGSESRLIVQNTVDTITVETPWLDPVTAGSEYTVTRGSEELFRGTVTGVVTRTFAVAGIDSASLRAATIEIIGGTGLGQSRIVQASDAGSITVTTPWSTELDETSRFVIHRYDGLALPSVTVRMNDDDQAGVVITQSEYTTVVIEGEDWADTYTVALTRMPEAAAIESFDVEDASSVVLEHLPLVDGDHKLIVELDDTELPSGQFNLDGREIMFSEAISGTIKVSYAYIEVTVTVTPDGQIDLGSGAGVPIELTFTSDNWNSPHTVTVAAAMDLVPEGFHYGYITHTVASADVDVFVELSEEIEGELADETSVMLAHYPLSDRPYSVRINGELRDPDRYELSASTIVFLDEEGQPEPVSGHVVVDYFYRLPGYDGVEVERVVVGIGDGDTPGVLITQTGGSTDVIEGVGSAEPWTDTYSVVLTRAPTADVTVNLTPEATRTTRGPLAMEEIQVSVSSATLTFTVDDWYIPQTVTVSAIDDDFVDGGDTKVFAPALHTVDGIKGPLFIDGAGGEGSLSGLTAPVMLPGETNVKASTGYVQGVPDSTTLVVSAEDVAPYGSLAYRTVEVTEGPAAAVGQFRLILGVEESGDDVQLILNDPWDLTPAELDELAENGRYAITNESMNFFVDEDERVDFLTVFHDDSVAWNTGELRDADTEGYDKRISGLGMGPDLTLRGETYPGGITYGDVEVVEINLGSGNDTFDVWDTHRREDGFRTWTMLNTGAGDDTVTVELDAEDDGLFALNAQEGDDTVDASESTLPLVIFGWDGDDTITAGQADDIVFGDRGRVDYHRLDQDDNDMPEVVTRLGAVSESLKGEVVEATPTTLLAGGSDFVPFPVADEGLRGSYVWINDGKGTGQSRLIVSNTENTLTLDEAWSVVPDATSKFFIAVRPSDQTNGEPLEPRLLFTVDSVVGGADVIRGGTGEDILIGGAGDDVIDGNEDADLIFGDNVKLDRRGEFFGDLTSPRFRELRGELIYDSGDNDLVDDDTDFVNPAFAEDQPSWANWQVILNEPSRFGFGGNDYIAGGPQDDMIFGQGGNDTIQGDGSIDLVVSASRDANGLLVLMASEEANTDGDDYVEGNGGADVIFGNLGQDDLIGGSSSLFSLTTADRRPDGADLIFGGAGTDIDRNYEDESATHARDADVILGDNGNVFRLVDTGGAPLGFAYDDAYGEQIVVRAARLLDYTPGGTDFDSAAGGDIGAGDEVHGESGDDSIYGMVGNDVLFGDSEDDDLIGGWGHDWISGGTGADGILGDDGRIYTSRNQLEEPLFGIAASPDESQISTPGNIHQAVIDPAGALKKTVNLTPYNPVTGGDELSDPQAADDIIYGGWGDDSLHGGAGDDAMSGAEALPEYFGAPLNAGDVLKYGVHRGGEFGAYDEFDPWTRVFWDPETGEFVTGGTVEFVLNFIAGEGLDVGTIGDATCYSDGDDRLFGDLGNDWLVGGTGRDHLYGGWGDDLLNADDDHDTNGGANDAPDTHPTYEDVAYGGAGRDVLIANTGGDRLIDWAGEFNSYIVPFAPFGVATVSRALQPQTAEYLYALSLSDGVDPTRAADEGSADPARNGEPFGELGLVRQQDFGWHEQTGAPADPQPGNVQGGARDVLRSASFDNASASGFFADSGKWVARDGVLQVAAESLGGDAVSVFHVGEQLPGYFEVQATISAEKPTGGWKANSFVIFDYQGRDNFKFAGADVALNKLVIGHRDASGWHVDAQSPVKGGVKAGQNYNVLLAINGLNATVIVNSKDTLTHTYRPTVVDGYAYGLNWGMVGVGSDNSRGTFDNVRVHVLRPQLTFEANEDFGDGVANLFTGEQRGTWAVDGKHYEGEPLFDGVGYSLIEIGAEHLEVSSYLELGAEVSTETVAGFIFDRYGTTSFKFAAIDAQSGEVVIGHYTAKGGWSTDAAASAVITPRMTLGVVLKGSTVSVTLNGQAVLGHAFNAATVDGGFGLLVEGAAAEFDDVRVRTDDPALGAGREALHAAGLPAPADNDVASLTVAACESMLSAAIARLDDLYALSDADVARLESVQLSIADLEGSLLGETDGATLWLDRDAAGFGWFVDATPLDDAEFLQSGRSDADGDMDLLSVLAHELGHVLGLAHEDGAVFMHESLSAGVRTLTVDAESAPVMAWTGETSFTRSLNPSPQFADHWVFDEPGEDEGEAKRKTSAWANGVGPSIDWQQAHRGFGMPFAQLGAAPKGLGNGPAKSSGFDFLAVSR